MSSLSKDPAPLCFSACILRARLFFHRVAIWTNSRQNRGSGQPTEFPTLSKLVNFQTGGKLTMFTENETASLENFHMKRRTISGFISMAIFEIQGNEFNKLINLCKRQPIRPQDSDHTSRPNTAFQVYLTVNHTIDYYYVTYQTLKTVFDHISKHREES